MESAAMGTSPDPPASAMRAYPPGRQGIPFLCPLAYAQQMDSTYNLNGGLKPTLKRFADLDGPDFYPTPDWATRALIDNEPFVGRIWEPACGDGTMVKVLRDTGQP